MPRGAADLIDYAFDSTSLAKNDVLPGQNDGVIPRKLNDGREFRIVKVFYEPESLTARLRQIGWNAALDRTASYFIYGSAERDAAVVAGANDSRGRTRNR